MRLLQQDTLILGIDYQEKMLPALHDKDAFIAASTKLFRGAAILSVPVCLTVQYVLGLGPTVEEIKAVTEGAISLEKLCFSAADCPGVMDYLKMSEKKQVVLCGCEAHVCVQQTAIDLIAAGYTVAVAADCVTSRRTSDRDFALARLRAEGVIVSACESLLFELARTSEHPNFKALSKLVK